MKLIILRGPSGIGKTTYIKNNFPEAIADGTVCSADHYFNDLVTGTYKFDPTKLGAAHQTCKTKVESLLADHSANNADYVVVDNTNLRQKEIKPYVDLAEKYDIPYEIITLQAPLELFLKRNVHNVPEDVVKGMYQRMMSVKLPSEWNQRIVMVGS